ncbi:hypothetical protein [Paenibacillus xerothermodurans]|uniref:hypothetical protein n=1 Tax=Paenibacillus xerothermodurans TaxID=1977292 RepID=UPI001401F599|nr:hypothetical protein [Paenibacillus xerothermodurans]
MTPQDTNNLAERTPAAASGVPTNNVGDPDAELQSTRFPKPEGPDGVRRLLEETQDQR